MTKVEERIAAHLAAVSPAGSVGASASQRCPPDTRTAMTERLVILSACAKESVIPLREKRIAVGLKSLAMTRSREDGLPQPFTRLRNDGTGDC